MEGLYVDNKHCLQIIMPYRNQGWVTYQASNEQKHQEGVVSTICRMSSSPRLIQLHADRLVNGVFDGEECIVWDDGEKWHRMHVSMNQMDFMTRRVYTPVTLVALFVVHRMVSRAWKCLQTLAAMLSEQ